MCFSGSAAQHLEERETLSLLQTNIETIKHMSIWLFHTAGFRELFLSSALGSAAIPPRRFL